MAGVTVEQTVHRPSRQQLIDGRTTMSKLTRTLILAAMVAAMNLAGMTLVAQAQPPDGVEQFRRGEHASQEQSTPAEAVEEFRRGEHAAEEQTAADAALQRQLARERFSIPSGTPAQAPAPVRSTEPGGQPDWLVLGLGVLAAILALVAGVAVMAARRAGRKVRPSQAT
jgi:hypothetical protein